MFGSGPAWPHRATEEVLAEGKLSELTCMHWWQNENWSLAAATWSLKKQTWIFCPEEPHSSGPEAEFRLSRWSTSRTESLFPSQITLWSSRSRLLFSIPRERRWICQIDQVSLFRDAKLFPVNCCAYILTIDRFWPWGRPCILVDWGCLSYSSCAWELSNFLNYSSCLWVYRLRAIYPRFALLVVNDITF